MKESLKTEIAALELEPYETALPEHRAPHHGIHFINACESLLMPDDFPLRDVTDNAMPPIGDHEDFGSWWVRKYQGIYAPEGELIFAVRGFQP